MVDNINNANEKIDIDDLNTHFYDLIHDFLFILDLEGRILKINKAVKERLGYSIDDLYNKSVLVMHPQERQQEVGKIVKKMLKDEIDACNVPILTKDGKLVPVETKITKEQIGNKEFLIGISRDITEKLKVENALLKEKKFIEMALNTQTDTFFVFDPSTGIPLRWNKAFSYISGYSDEEISKLKAPETYYDKEDLQKLSEAIELIKSGETTVNEARLKTKDGKFIPFEYIASGIFDEENNLKYIVAVGRNITDRLEAERKIRESEEKFRSIAEHSAIGIFIVQDNKIKFINHKALEEMGYSHEELMNWTLEDILKTAHPEDRDFIKKQAIKKQRGDKDVVVEYEARFINKYNKIIWVKNLSKTIMYDGRPADLISHVYINDMKEAELKLRESEEKFRNLSDQSLMGILIAQDNKIKYVNRAYAEIFGYSVEEMMNWELKDAINAIHKDDRDFALQQLAKKQTGDKDITNRYSYRGIRKSGEIIWIENYSKTIIYEGRPADLVVQIDITDKLQAEEKLKESEEKFRSIAEQSSIGIAILQDNEIKFINHKAAEEIGYPYEDVKNWKLENILKTVHPDDRDFVREQALKKQRDEKDVVIEYEHRILNKNNDILWVKNLSKTIMYNGRPADFISQVYINDMKQAEFKLKESEEKYRHLFNITPFPIVILDSKGIIIDANTTTLKAFGVKKEEFVGESSLTVQNFSSEIFELIKERQELLLKGKSVGALEVPIVLKDGSKRWINSNISLFHLEDKPYFQVIIQDITDKKDSELKLKESENKFRTIFEAIPDLYFIVSEDTTILDYRGNIEQFYISPELFIGKKISEIMPESIGKESLMAAKKTMKTREPQIVEYDLEINGKISTYEARHLYLKKDRILIFVRDITERKKAQQKLIESETNFRDLYEEAPNAYFSIDTNGYIKNCNIAAKNLLNYTKKEFLKMNVFDLYANNENGKVKAIKIFKRFLNAEKIKDEELQMKKKNGELIWVSLTVRAILDNTGKVVESRSMVIDINDRKKIEERIADIARFPSENPYPVIRANLKEILYINQSGFEMLKLTVGSKPPEYLIKYIEDSLYLNEIKEFEITIDSHTISFVSRPIKEADHVNLYGRDITERKRALENLKISEANYREAYGRVNFYKDLIAHDLNNVLQSILSSVELHYLFNKDFQNSDKINEIFNIINDSALRGAKLISNVQKLSKLENSKLTIQEINLCNNLKEAINFTRNKYQKKKISIQVEGANSNYINVQANDLLLDVFENILINAVKYNDNNEIEILIKISELEKEMIPHVKIEFIDNGIGVEDARKDKIFEVGHREFKGGRGMGMGLSLVKKAIESYGGEIYVRDKVEGEFSKGSNFILIMRKS